MTEETTQEMIGPIGTKSWHEGIAAAVARGWCSPENINKTIDSVLHMAIVAEVETLLKTDIHPRLGCATTQQLIDEVACRIGIDLQYRTIGSL